MSHADLCGWRPAALLAALLLGGCAGDRSLNATTVLSYDQCQGIDAGLTQVDYAQVAGIRGSTLLDMSRPEPEAGDDDLLLIAISRGRQPTPGYGFTLEDAQRRNGTAVVSLGWRTPESGAVLPQVLTHPCLVVGLPRSGIERVEAVDSSGTELGILDL